MKPARPKTDPDAVALVEEAVHLLRETPLATWAVYVAGAIPFVVGVLFFWAHTTWFAPSGSEIAWSALGLSFLFVVLKVAQAEFCAQLMARRLGNAAPGWSRTRLTALTAAQLRVQPWALLATGLAAVAVIPFGWAFAYGQILTVIGDDPRLHGAAVDEAKRWPVQNHFGLLLIFGVAACVWLNLATAFFAVPWLANRLLGIDNLFGLSGWSLLNSTCLAGITALSWLATDPLVKAYYTLWVFHGRSRRTGDDIRIEFLRSRAAGAAARGAALAALAVMIAVPHLSGSPASAKAPSTPAVQAAPLDKAIDDVLAGPDFSWRLRPLPAPADARPRGPLERFIQQGADIVRAVLHTAARWVQSVVRWLDRHFSSSKPAVPSGAGGAVLVVVKILLYGLLALAGLLLLWLVSVFVRQRPWRIRTVVQAQAVAAAPDLRDENVHAAQLPPDGWLALAQAEITRGEWRLALRALYLATLARLAAEGLIGLASFKTNLDYERELRRRALSRTDVVDGFSLRRRAFEAVWYGRVVPTEADVRHWLAELERPASP